MADETAIIQYLAGLPEADRKEAFSRINAGIKLMAPVEEVDPIKKMWTTLGDYLDEDLDVPPFVVSAGQVIKGEITVLVARAGRGKTTLARNRMIRWSAGLPLFPELTETQTPEGPLKIGLLENEGVAWDMQRKLKFLLEDAGLDMEQRAVARENLRIWGDGGYSGLKIDNDEDFKKIDYNLGEADLDIFIMEPFRGLWRGEENDATQMEETLDRMVQLAVRHNCAVMLSHHERKSGAGEDGEWMSASRGSGVLEGKVAVMENFRVAKDGLYRELSWSKSRYYPPRGPIVMEFDEETHRYTMVPESELAQEISALLTQEGGDWFTAQDLADHFHEDVAKVYKATEQLVDSGSIIGKSKKTEGGRRAKSYRAKLADEGESQEGLSLS